MSGTSRSRKARHLVLVLGDQFDHDSAAFDGFDHDADVILMAEVDEEASYVPQHKIRLALFFAAMRHFRDEVAGRGLRIGYSEWDDQDNRGSFAGEIERWVTELEPAKVILVQPGDYRVEQGIKEAARALDLTLEIRDDRRFYGSPAEFESFAEGRKPSFWKPSTARCDASRMCSCEATIRWASAGISTRRTGKRLARPVRATSGCREAFRPTTPRVPCFAWSKSGLPIAPVHWITSTIR